MKGILAVVAFVLLAQPGLALSEDQAEAIAQERVNGDVFSVEKTGLLHRAEMKPAYKVGLDKGTSSITYVYVSEAGDILAERNALKGRVFGAY